MVLPVTVVVSRPCMRSDALQGRDNLKGIFLLVASQSAATAEAPLGIPPPALSVFCKNCIESGCSGLKFFAVFSALTGLSLLGHFTTRRNYGCFSPKSIGAEGTPAPAHPANQCVS